VFKETYIMGSTLGSIRGLRAEVVLQLHPFIIHPSIQSTKMMIKSKNIRYKILDTILDSTLISST
jgi:hypothetical protein